MTEAQKRDIWNRDEARRMRYERKYSVVFARSIMRQLRRFMAAAERDGFQVAAQNVRLYINEVDIRESFVRLYTEVGRAFNQVQEDDIKSVTGWAKIEYKAKTNAFIQTKDFDMPDSVFSMNLQEYIDRYLGRKITFINQTTQSWVVRQVAEIGDNAIREGVPIPEQTETLTRFFRQEAPDFAAYRARRIARTETVGAANYAKNEVIESVTGVRKIWISDTSDLERTRITHQNVEPVMPGKKFQVGNSLLKFPGDPDGEAREVINCRCTTGVERI